MPSPQLRWAASVSERLQSARAESLLASRCKSRSPPAFCLVPQQGKPICLLIASVCVAQGEIEALEDAANELMLADEEQVRIPFLCCCLWRLPGCLTSTVWCRQGMG